MTDSPLSCISGHNPGADCGFDNWDTDNSSTSPDLEFYTVCCDGDIIDFTGFNSYPGYTLLLKNLLCCPSQDPGDSGPFYDETKGCKVGSGTPLSSYLETSTEVAVPWTTKVGDATSTLQPECFWSQLGLDKVAFDSSTATRRTLDASSSPITTTGESVSSIAVVNAASSSSSVNSVSSLASSSLSATTSVASPTIDSRISDSASASQSSAIATGVAASGVAPGWLVVVIALSSYCLTVARA